MKVVGLITEYNPFHNGHKYHIEEAKRVTGADYAIAVMSGNFVQRGAPAIIDKYSRTEMALQNGIDLVLELPVCYATGSAEFFAHGAVSLLDKLGIIDFLCFGSEAGDVTLLEEAARFLNNTSAAFDVRLQSFLKDGFTYPAARLKALKLSLEEKGLSNAQELTKVLTEPNNILGIEYIKALLSLSSSIIPVTIQRKSAHYHDSRLAEVNSVDATYTPEQPKHLEEVAAVISSATAIRKAINNKDDNPTYNYFADLELSIPTNVHQILSDNYLKTFPITEEDFSQIIKYKLLSEDKKTLTSYVDITKDLADRLKNIPDLNLSISELCQHIKTKNYTLTRINRAMFHLLLNIKAECFDEYNRNSYVAYARVLGVKKESTHLLRKIEAYATIPLITKVSKADKHLDNLGMSMFSEDLFASHLYNQVVYDKYKTNIVNEYKHGLVII